MHIDPKPSLYAEYSKSLMREAKAHFESAPEAPPRAESAPASSSSSSSGSSTTSSTSQPQKAESGRLHLTSRDSSSSNGSALQDAIATDRSPSNTSQAGGDASVLGDAKRNPQTALAAAHRATKQPGSSTALVLQFTEGSNTLKASNLASVYAGIIIFKPKIWCVSVYIEVCQIWACLPAFPQCVSHVACACLP